MPELTKNTPVVFHCRRRTRDGVLQNNGGATVVYDPVSRRFGMAVCSLNDPYRRKIGREIALGILNQAHNYNTRSVFSIMGISHNRIIPHTGPNTMEAVREHAIALGSEVISWMLHDVLAKIHVKQQIANILFKETSSRSSNEILPNGNAFFGVVFGAPEITSLKQLRKNRMVALRVNK